METNKNKCSICKNCGKFLFSFAILIGACGFLIQKALELPKAREFRIPERTKWKPKGQPLVGNYSYEIITKPITFRTMHVTLGNTDQVWTAAAPVFEYAWSVEPEMYVIEGPTLDDEGNLYFSPFSPKENISLISLDGVSGKRRWIIEDPIEGGGAPLILNDPDHKGRQIVYYSHYEIVSAIETSGKILWRTETGLKRPPNRKMHIWGCNYHALTDTIVILSIDAELIAVDRKTGRLRSKKKFTLPGSPSKNSDVHLPKQFLIDRGNEETDRIFGKTKVNKISFNEAIINAVLAENHKVSNFFCIDPNSGAIYIAATAEDELDGKKR